MAEVERIIQGGKLGQGMNADQFGDYASEVVWKSMQRSPTKRGKRRSVGPALIGCRNSFSSFTGGKANGDDLRGKDWDGSALLLRGEEEHQGDLSYS